MILAADANLRLVERAATLIPMLRERAAAAEQARRLPPDTFDALSDADVFRMTAPKRFGGYEADFLTQCQVLAELARGCPSASWVSTIFSAMSWLVSTFPDEVQEEVFASGDPRISGVFSPTGIAVRTDGGFVVSGRWGFNTGGHGAAWTVLNAVHTREDGMAVPMCVLTRSRDLTRLDDWHASGMAATGSSTVVAEDLFVPSARVQPLPEMIEARFPARQNAGHPYFNYPLTTPSCTRRPRWSCTAACCAAWNRIRRCIEPGRREARAPLRASSVGHGTGAAPNVSCRPSDSVALTNIPPGEPSLSGRTTIVTLSPGAKVVRVHPRRPR